jgi:MFS family permease
VSDPGVKIPTPGAVPDTAPAAALSVAPDTHPHRWRALALVSLAVLLGMSLWFVGSAVAAQLQQRWSLDGAGVAWLTIAVQLGFVAGTAVAAVLNLADVIPARTLFAASALAGAVVNSALVFADSLGVALLSRFLAGACLAGVYPPAMKMTSTWFRQRRGLAVGTVVGALTIGKAGPYLIGALPGATVAGLVALSSLSAAAAAVLVWCWYADGPYVFPSRPFSWTLVGRVVREPQYRQATGGYLGHMTELYAYWTWIPAFVAASMAADAQAIAPAATRTSSLIGFAIIAVGGAGCVWGGAVADRIGRARLVTLAMAVSGACCALIGLLFGHSLWLLTPVALVWGFFIIADSAQFSVLVTESVPPHAVGTALTLQVSLGFLLTTLTIQVVPAIVRTAGWPWAFVFLAVGPLAGIWSIRRLARVEHL